ncbi:MAG: hypothetical protein PHD68_03235 [Rugosibacter sp.]|nr:hypothetical protein [Rugosibacter sp.]
MKHKLTPALALFSVVTLFTASAMAQTATPRVDQRQINQQQRIDQGVSSGTLTEKEAARMERGQTRVENLEDRAKSDGTVTNRERARMHHSQDVQSSRIYQQKHDRQNDMNHDGRIDRPAQRPQNQTRRQR